VRHTGVIASGGDVIASKLVVDGDGNAAMKQQWRAYARDVAGAYAVGFLGEGPVPAAR
jgi:hypothetical protein